MSGSRGLSSTPVSIGSRAELASSAGSSAARRTTRTNVRSNSTGHRPVQRAAAPGAGTLAKVAEAVAGLPDRQRLVFTLSHVDERSAARISAATGASPATVRVHLFRALRKLRAMLGIDHEPPTRAHADGTARCPGTGRDRGRAKRRRRSPGARLDLRGVRAKLSQLVASFDDLRDEAYREADARFPEPMLEAQRTRVLIVSPISVTPLASCPSPMRATSANPHVRSSTGAGSARPPRPA